jgi:plasmid stabilization system protein ParE
MVQVYWTRYAKVSLQEVVNFIRSRWGEKKVDQFVTLIDQKISLLKTNAHVAPKIGLDNIRKWKVHKYINVFYRENKDRIEILLVWDNRQNPARLVEVLKTS